MTLCAHNMSVRLGTANVVTGVTLSFGRGRVTAILGPNGAGKTSLIRALTGIIPCDGEIKLDNAPLPPPAERARRIGYLPQNGMPAWNVEVRELVALGRLPHRGRLSAVTSADEAAIDSALAATDTSHLATRTIDTLSGGERGRVMMARVLAGDPDWIIADEPLANLDPPHQRDLLALFKAAAASGKGVIVILHQLNAAMRAADDVVLMNDGRIIAQGPKADALTPAYLEQAFGMEFELVPYGGQMMVAPKA